MARRPAVIQRASGVAEAARQAGRQAPGVPARDDRPPPLYDRSLTIAATRAGEIVHLDELEA